MDKYTIDLAMNYAKALNRIKTLEHQLSNMFKDLQNPGIYELWQNGVLVYIGQSGKNMLTRIGQHTKDKAFDYVAYNDDYYLREDRHRLKAESELIKQHRPRLNRVHNGKLNK